ncbi:terminase small subunit family protein [Megasphaera elsdenii CAG:570]|uniref:Terminase small subunit family protein n=1 Tax=Megasphaera elsdenii CAG:570 TaxID=1263087 RepID=R7MVM8_MEGEL|nr:terminase small subunit family protein [Megasphaera elsdenii CAG:570]
MVMNFRPYLSAIFQRSGVRIIVPSSAMISQHRPTCLSPARRMRSTVASVWPLRVRTPPRLAMSGKLWPGRRKSSGRADSSTHLRAVRARSTAEMPVVVSTWSMETVKAVSWLSVFSLTIWGRPSLWAYSMLIGMQIRPLPWLAMKFMFSVVQYWAAQMKSPSFSRSGSSVTMMIWPACNSSSASSMVLNLRFSVVKIKTSLKSVYQFYEWYQKSPGQWHRALTCKERQAASAARHIFFHPDYTVGFGIAPNHEPVAPTP